MERNSCTTNEPAGEGAERSILTLLEVKEPTNGISASNERLLLLSRETFYFPSLPPVASFFPFLDSISYF